MEQQIEPQNKNAESKSSNLILILVSVVISVLATATIVYFWQNQTNQSLQSKAQKNISALEKQLLESQTQISSLQNQLYTAQTQNSSTANISDNNSNNLNPENFSDIITCDTSFYKRSYLHTYKPENISKETLNSLGITQYISDGYKIEDICKEDNLIGFILAKEQPDLYLPDQKTYVCEGSCDKDILGVIDFAKNKQIVKEYNGNLGIYSESYSAFCQIDKLMSEKENLSDSAMLFYCGTGENEGFNWWYQYKYSDNSLSRIMSVISTNGDNYDLDEYDTKSESVLKLFRNQSRKDIYKK
ncbi:MAG: hypothetical protein WCT36_04865 [Candidatus Gracilibacteria bacterium]|jgi:type II secretory pathway pseudopilin PulG